MFASMKRIAILTALLVFPGMAFGYVSMRTGVIDNWVPVGSQGFVIHLGFEVGGNDNYGSTEFYFGQAGFPYQTICLDHEDFGDGRYTKVFYVPFEGGDTAQTDDTVYWDTYASDDCSGSSNLPLTDFAPMFVGFNEGWPEVIRFLAVKRFEPTSDEEVQIDINCSAGLPGDDSAILGEDELQIFPQEFLNPSNPNHDCVITEANVPDGYKALYVMGQGTPAVTSEDGCFFYGSGNMRADNYCTIRNIGLPSTFIITKDWEIFQDDAQNEVPVQDQRALLLATCSDEILGMHVVDQGFCDEGCTFLKDELGNTGQPKQAGWTTTGDAVVTFTVEQDGSSRTVCNGYEQTFYSNVERTFTDCWSYASGPIDFELAPGGSAECGFINTVFFEGIPTLSQYGLAIMALLMLGVGFVGFRRFV